MIRDDTINIQVILSSQAIAKMNKLLYIIGNMDTEIKSFRCQMENIEKTVFEQRTEILKLNDLIKTKGIPQSQVTPQVVEPSQQLPTAGKSVNRAEMNKITVISTLMSRKCFASEAEELLRQL